MHRKKNIVYTGYILGIHWGLAMHPSKMKVDYYIFSKDAKTI